jgi:hypothetical protein
MSTICLSIKKIDNSTKAEGNDDKNSKRDSIKQTKREMVLNMLLTAEGNEL